MPSIPIRTALAASSQTFPMQGTRYEIAPYNAVIEVAVSADATGVLVTFGSGTDAIQDEGPVQVGTINVQPIYPDNYFLKDVIAAGERILYSLRDTSGAARVVQAVFIMTPLTGQ
jgi:hypothetical protein